MFSSGDLATEDSQSLWFGGDASFSSGVTPATSPEEERTRSGHNQVEKQYRNRLNQYFERLLAVLPASLNTDGDQQGEDKGLDLDKRLSKTEVLDIARRHIRTLERETSELEVEKQQLVDEIGRQQQLRHKTVDDRESRRH
ncbi:hypothetical protein NKR23_g11899 [Pleurostoma richardsiae]|uniref:BHLH domain-containing protein n=1 Tax=Pleurostoma richardsiae TaxID=41990 RepID=A0AA38RAU8_9PEZI|nr:hypothetical protein NKR23_g11899 [Pleurostoma richardsiae]